MPDSQELHYGDKMTHQNKKNKGRILSLKVGYNPNSSSVGSHIPYFFVFAAGSGMLSIIILHLLNYYDKHILTHVKKFHRYSNSVVIVK